jgi:TolB protein
MRDRLRFTVLLALGLPGAVYSLLAAQDRVETGVTFLSRGPGAIRVALPEFQPAGDSPAAVLNQVFNDTLQNDLAASGNIEVASPSFYPVGRFALPGDIRAEDWRGPGIEAAYIGFGTTAQSGRTFTVEARLMDLRSPSQDIVIAARYGPVPDSEQGARTMAHVFAEAILERLGFGKGVTRTRIAFVSDRSGNKEIHIMDYDGHNQYALTAVQNIAITPAWSPDGQRLAYSAWRLGPANIEIVSVGGQRFPFQQVAGLTNATPAWSPDGRSLAYSSAGPEGTDIYVANADGSGRQRLTFARQIDTSPSWNPATGNEIAFVSRRNGSPQLFVMAKDGTDVRQLTNEGGEAQNPAYSPDGRFIAFAWQRPGGGGFDIYLHTIATGRNTQLTQGAGSNERPAWSPDGKHIAFQSNRNGTTQIYSMLADGKNVRQLTRTGRINEGPAWSGYIQ